MQDFLRPGAGLEGPRIDVAAIVAGQSIQVLLAETVLTNPGIDSGSGIKQAEVAIGGVNEAAPHDMHGHGMRVGSW